MGEARHLVQSGTAKKPLRLGASLRLCLLLLIADVIAGAFFVATATALRVALPGAGAIALVFVVAILYQTRIRPDSYDLMWKAVFPVALLVCGLSYSIFFTPMVVPDEVYHYTQSYLYSNVMLTGHADSFRKADLDFLEHEDPDGIYLTRETWQYVSGELGRAPDPSDGQSVISARRARAFDTAVNPLQVKLPSVLGIVVGRLCNLSPVITFYLGRIFALLFGVALVSLAVNITPVGKAGMAAAALFPMTMQLLGSYSYDSGIIAYAFLLTALMLRLILGEGPVPRGQLVAALVVALLIAPCKMVYYPITLLALLIPGERFSSRRSEWLCKGALLLVPLASILVTRFASIAAISDPSTTRLDRRGPETGTFYNISDFLASPLSFAALVANTFLVEGDAYLLGVMGGLPGWWQENLYPPYYFSFFLLACALLLAMPSQDDGRVLPRRTRLASLLVVLLSGFLIMFSMYLGWTFNTEQTIAGVQGRYMLPLVPLLLVALRDRHVRLEGRTALPAIVIFASSDLMYLSFMAMIVLTG